MSQQPKSSMNAEGNLSQSTEAAIKLLPRASKSEQVHDGGPIDKDGFDGMQLVRSYYIEVALNGFFVTIVFNDDTPDLRYVVQDMSEVVEILKGKVL